MRNAASHLYWNREKENRGEWKKDVMFSCCRNEKATEVILNLSASLKMSPYSSLSWHPSTRPALSSPCVHARFLPAPWVEGTSQSDSALLRPCPELTSHDKGGTHTVTWSLNNSPFVPSNWGCWSRYNAVPCALPCWPSPNTHRWQNKRIHSKYDLRIYLTPTRLHSYRHTKEKYTPLI